jgi:hypothetical protein
LVTVLTCTICASRPSFAKVRLEITGGAATYLVCSDPDCIGKAFVQAHENMERAAVNLGVAHANVVDVNVVDVAELES